MTLTSVEIVRQLKSLGVASYRKVLLSHGVVEPLFGVKISELKRIRKRTGKDYQLALELYDTGIYDAQYLAGLIADEAKMTKKDLRHWLAKANCPATCGFVVAAVAAESAPGWELAMEWIESKQERVAQTGWATLSALVSVKEDSALDLQRLKRLLEHVGKTIHDQPNDVRYTMNGFVIASGAYVSELSKLAKAIAGKIGVVTVDMGETECKVPFAPEYIKKCIQRGSLTKKRKSARC